MSNLQVTPCSPCGTVLFETNQFALNAHVCSLVSVCVLVLVSFLVACLFLPLIAKQESAQILLQTLWHLMKVQIDLILLVFEEIPSPM